MSRKRDTNWNRDEITVLLDSIMKFTRTRANDGERTSSREVFEYAAKMMEEKGHASRAAREKCRTKWKKMKEEFAHAKRAREGDPRYKESPGIQPFYDRMEEFINGNFDNISPHSTIVRRTSLSASSSSSSRQAQLQPQQLQQQQQQQQTASGMTRASARIAANTNGINTNDTNSTIVTKPNTSTEFLSSSAIHTPSSNNNSPPSRQNSRLSSSSNSVNGTTNKSNGGDSVALSLPSTTMNIVNLPNNTNNNNSNNNHHSEQSQAIPNGDSCSIYANYSSGNTNNNTSISSHKNNNNNCMLTNSSIEHPLHNQSTEHADISYRVSTGCRQITIFGDHDVDIKFRGDCVTINKISADYSATET